MAKITLPTIAAGFASNSAFNTAYDLIEAEFQNKVLYRNNTCLLYTSPSPRD